MGSFKSLYHRCIARHSEHIFRRRESEDFVLRELDSFNDAHSDKLSPRGIQSVAAHELECFYASRQVEVLTDYTVRTILKELQDYVRDFGKAFDADSITKQLVQCQIFIYVSNLIPPYLLNDYPDLKQFVLDCFECTRVRLTDLSEDLPVEVKRNQNRYYSCHVRESFERIACDESSSEKLLLAPSPHQSLETSAKYFLLFGFFTTSAYFIWRVALPRYTQYIQHRYPQEGGIVIYIPEE